MPKIIILKWVRLSDDSVSYHCILIILLILYYQSGIILMIKYCDRYSYSVG